MIISKSFRHQRLLSNAVIFSSEDILHKFFEQHTSTKFNNFFIIKDFMGLT